MSLVLMNNPTMMLSEHRRETEIIPYSCNSDSNVLVFVPSGYAFGMILHFLRTVYEVEVGLRRECNGRAGYFHSEERISKQAMWR